MNPLQRLYPEQRQSVWFDFISKKLLDSGALARLVADGEIRGVTSNPSIFEKSVGEGVEYAEVLSGLRAKTPGASTFELYEALAIRDIQAACDVMKPVYQSSKARDGYVSLEVTLFAGDSTDAIVAEAVHLWKAVARPNVMIKVPGTPAGIEASKGLIAAGINVNVTLLFSVAQYEATAEAFQAGLEARLKSGGELARVASVASFFVSRIDSVVDKQLDEKGAAAKSAKDKPKLEALRGKAAIANAKVAYARYQKLFSGKRWDKLAAAGAQTQRVLWASTGTKNKAYSDVLYIEELIGPETVNTAPPQTIDAFRDHGKPRTSLTEGLDAAKKQLKGIADAGVSLDKVTSDLLVDGLKQFGDAFTKLLKAVEGSRGADAAKASTPAAKPATRDLFEATAPIAKGAASASAAASAKSGSTLTSSATGASSAAKSNAPSAGTASSTSGAAGAAGTATASNPSNAAGATAARTAAPATSTSAANASSSSKSSSTPASVAPSAPAFQPLAFRASDALTKAVQRELDDWTSAKVVDRLWARDAKLWSGADEARWLAWLEAPAKARATLADLRAFADEVRNEGVKHVVLLGMGGSSLGPEVLKLVFGSKAGFPTLEVLDSTDPAQVAAIEAKVDLAQTLFVVASKSGSTLEPSIFELYFFERAKAKLGAKAGSRFVAITDPGSKLEAIAKQKGYRRIFAGVPEIGGRFSALSNFGLVPAALLGIDLERFVARAEAMAAACKGTDAAANPGVQLGAIVGIAARQGRDKLTLVTSPKLAPLGAWLEQLVAESTGKLGKGVIPIDQEPLAGPSSYGDDRIFVYLRFDGAPDPAQDAAVDALERAGHAVVRLRIGDTLDLGAEFFRFEIATAVIGALLGINAFDQPDVEAAKIATRALTDEYDKNGSLPAERPFFEEDGIRLFADRARSLAFHRATGADATLVDVLRAHFATIGANDYVALLAYVEMTGPNAAELQSMRTAIRDTTRAATCVGFGPRFLHSTGQAYKGGPNSGVFLQITCDDAKDVEVPGAKYTFGVVKSAQARGDFQVLVERGRRALRVHLGADVKSGLATLRKAVASALSKPSAAKV